MNPQGLQTGHGTHEHKDADVISLGLIGAVLLLVITICLLVCGALLHRLDREPAARPPRLRAVEQIAKFPEPRLITQPGEEWRATQLAARARLQTYGWADRKAGVAHIPIKEAMQQLLARGLPEVGAGQTRLQLMQARAQGEAAPNEPSTSPTPEATP